MLTVLLAIGLIAAFFAMMSVRLIFLKQGEFKGTCATQNPFLQQQGIKCACGKEPGTCDSATGSRSDLPKIERSAVRSA
ncbi:MAG: hypothetical protein WBA12_04870 [Catalinimonas sp.]